MTLPYSGRTTCYEHKREGWEATPGHGKDAIRTVKLIEAQWSNMPVEVEEDVKAAWKDHELGNDVYYWSTSLELIREEGAEGREYEVFDSDAVKWVTKKTNYAYLIQWLEEQGVEEKEELLIHWWW